MLQDVEKPIDWHNWLERWHAQQSGYLYDRAGRFTLMLDYVARQRGNGALRILDLCSGPGSISEVALQYFPQATTVAIDYDPWLVELGKQVLGEGRITWIEADLRKADWLQNITPGSFDAVLSATALHWFAADELVALYNKLATVLSHGGIFLNADHQPLPAPRLTELGDAIDTAFEQTNFAKPGIENWGEYWAAVRAEPAFQNLLAERDRRFPKTEHGHPVPVTFHQEALRVAGFQEIGEVWRHSNDAILAAIR